LYLSFHHRLAAYLGIITKRLYLIPHPTAIGNASEDYLFGLLYAKKNRRKLVTMICHPMLAKTGLKMFSPQFLAYGNDLTSPKYGSRIYKILSFLVSLYFFISRLAVKLIYRIFKINLPDSYFHPSLGQDIIWQPKSLKKFDWALVDKIDWDSVFDDSELKLELPLKKQQYCDKLFQEFGLPKGAWFVCVHVREGGYSGDHQNIRNATIDNYLEAIQFITSQGGWVFRMGDTSMKNLPPLEHVIDYANSTKRHALLDVYLIANCKYFVGTSSGIFDTALLFGKPTLLTNAVHFLMQMPQKRNDLIIFKHVYSKNNGNKLTLREWLLDYDKLESSTWSSLDWVFAENSSEEITAAVKNLMGFGLDSENVQLQLEFKALHLKACKGLSLKFKVNENTRVNVSDWYRFASSLISWNGRVCSSYLEENWQ